MRYHLATDNQLKSIINDDNGCPPSLLEGVAVEMMNRNLLENLIVFAAKKVYKNVDYILDTVLRISKEELIHLGHIEIYKQVKRFQPGMQNTPKTFLIMCLVSHFQKLIRNVGLDIRKANYEADWVDGLDIKLYEATFKSIQNVERQVIAKMTVESIWGELRPIEQQAVIMEQEGYSKYEIAEKLGFHRRSGSKLLKRAYTKLREAGA